LVFRTFIKRPGFQVNPFSESTRSSQDLPGKWFSQHHLCSDFQRWYTYQIFSNLFCKSYQKLPMQAAGITFLSYFVFLNLFGKQYF